jgi:hypothetical protein
MKKIVGLAMIVFGMMAGASTATLNLQNEKAGKPADQRFFESLGGACCSLALVVPGFILALSGGKKGDEKYRPSPRPDRESGSDADSR